VEDDPNQSRDESLNMVLDTLADAGDDDEVTIGQILDEFGDRSLAPVLLVPALLTASPISGIPGVPTVTGIIVALIVVQMLMGKDTLWVPQALARRGVSRQKMDKAVNFLRKPVGWIDRLLKPRLTWLAERPWNYVALLTCLAIAVLAPGMELLPFVISIAAVAIGFFAAGILVRDGLVILLGYVVVGIVAVLAWQLV
jgi:hypothetical protein